MTYRYAVIIFHVLIPALCSSAAEPRCHQCDHLSKLSAVCFDSETINFISYPFQPISEGVLVVVQTSPLCYQRAIMVSRPDEQNQEAVVHLCSNHEQVKLSPNAIRILKPLWQLNWQPIPPIAMTKQLINIFLKNNQQRNPRILTMLISQDSQISVVGDLHGALLSLLEIFNRMETEKKVNSALKLTPGNLLVTLGDYSDREPFGIEIWHYLLQAKLINEYLFLVRGNHELRAVAAKHQFLKEYFEKIGNSREDNENLDKLFSALPQAILIGFKHSTAPFYRFVLLCHGGIDPLAPVSYAMEQVIKKYKLQGSFPAIETIPLTYPQGIHPGSLWNEFIANDLKRDLPQVRNSQRGPGIYAYNTSAARLYIRCQHSDISEEDSYRLDLIVCGHIQFPDALAKLNDQVTKESHWTAIQPGQTYKAKTGDVFTCNASNKSSYKKRASTAAGHFSTFTPTDDGNWHVTAH